jgi:hypothetical protein
VRSRALEGASLDGIEADAVRIEKLHAESIQGLKGETDEERTKIADHERFRDLVGLAHRVKDNFDAKSNTFLLASPDVKSYKFTDVTKKAGLEGVKGTQVSAADLDNDGLEDLLFDGHVWLKQRKGGTFERGADLPEARAALAADFNNDGFLDLLQIGGEKTRVLLNDGMGKFKEMEKAGFEDDGHVAGGACVADFDRDGFVDVYLSKSDRKEPDPSGAVQLTYDKLYLNDKGAGFTDASEKAGIRKVGSMLGWGATACDFDADGDADVYVCNHNRHFDKNYLWLNDGSAGFEEEGEARNVCGTPKKYKSFEYHGHSYAAVFGDVDGDGDADLFVANLCNPRYLHIIGASVLLVNGGESAGYKFEDRTAACGVRFHQGAADVSFADYDNDGDLDLYVGCGGDADQSCLYQNDGKGKFTDVTWQSRTPAFGAESHAWLDYDEDGDLDLAVASKRGVRLFKNGSPKRHGWMEFKLHGDKSNAAGIGARIVIRAGKEVFVREAACGRGRTSQDSLIVHFGLGRYKGAVDVEVRWPSGAVVQEKMKAGRRHVLQEK